jgi:hypothetical protein
VAALTTALSGPNRELRRSAAAGLARSPHALALPALLTAYDLEREHLTRAVLLLAIGRRNEAAARRFLLDELRGAPKALRSFAALGLALHVRDRADADAKAELRAAFAAEHNHSARGAWLLALGLARAEGALDLLGASLTGGTPEMRMVAAEALALTGTPAAAQRLRLRLGVEPCPAVLSAVAAALCTIGAEGDAAAVAALLRSEARFEAAIGLADALGRRPSALAAGALRELAADGTRPALVRAAAVAALGQIVREPPPERLLDLVRGANWRALPPWVEQLLAVAM